MLWRLNHELFPEPGIPIAKITTPFGRAPVADDAPGAADPLTLGAGGVIALGIFCFKEAPACVCPEDPPG
jgi:hypothetical protein